MNTAKLLGAQTFDPTKRTRMIAGVAPPVKSRRPREACALECAALRHVRRTWGLSNVIR